MQKAFLLPTLLSGSLVSCNSCRQYLYGKNSPSSIARPTISRPKKSLLQHEIPKKDSIASTNTKAVTGLPLLPIDRDVATPALQERKAWCQKMQAQCSPHINAVLDIINSIHDGTMESHHILFKILWNNEINAPSYKEMWAAVVYFKTAQDSNFNIDACFSKLFGTTFLFTDQKEQKLQNDFERFLQYLRRNEEKMLALLSKAKKMNLNDDV